MDVPGNTLNVFHWWKHILAQVQQGLPPPLALQFSHKTGEGSELKARETGDEHARDHGKEKEER